MSMMMQQPVRPAVSLQQPAPAAVAADNSVTLEQLESLLGPLAYVDKPRVARDVLGLLRNSNSLTYKVGQLVQPNGTRETLLHLIGTTPIYYKNACYNIPVCIWLVPQYPHRPPTCFVTPTKDMRIKDGHLHVDHYGTIYLPYLNQWNAQNSNLLEMVTMMSSVFSTDPPVFKVPANASASANAQPAAAASPAAAAAASPLVSQASPSAQRQASPYNSNPYAQQPSFGSNSNVQQQSQPSPINQPATSFQVRTQPQDERATRKNQLLATLTSRLRQQLQDDLSLKTLLTDDLRQTQQQLESHKQTIADQVAALTSDLAALDAASASLETKNAELRAWLEANEKREMVEVDKLAYVKDTHSKQLLEVVALDASISDAYYLLDAALAAERLDLSSYTKQIRNLARKQFYSRALAQQIVATQQQNQLGNGHLQQQPSQLAMYAR